jgi:dCMP deaminase
MENRKIPTWDEYFFKLIGDIAERSKDPNTQVGTVIVGPNNEIRATGYNSLPRKVKDLVEDVPERFERPEKYLWMEHAERNAIYASVRVGTPLNGCKIYLNGLPCMDCARALIQVGIVEVIVDYNKYKKWFSPKYTIDNDKVIKMLGEAGVQLRWVVLNGVGELDAVLYKNKLL